MPWFSFGASLWSDESRIFRKFSAKLWIFFVIYFFVQFDPLFHLFLFYSIQTGNDVRSKRTWINFIDSVQKRRRKTLVFLTIELKSKNLKSFVWNCVKIATFCIPSISNQLKMSSKLAIFESFYLEILETFEVVKIRMIEWNFYNWNSFLEI